MKRKDLPPGAQESSDGRSILCAACSTSVDFRDADGEFTLANWNTHRHACVTVAATASSSPPLPKTSLGAGPARSSASGAGTSAVERGRERDRERDREREAQHRDRDHQPPPAKRRRAKRTEEERITYLRSDPYVAQFEAYRVLCASCDKWIRLRPNSTYCSIPWDAHRKSCLNKKVNMAGGGGGGSKNVFALEERNSLFSKDPDVRKYDAERILCRLCDQWLGLPIDDHLQAVQKWLQHRAVCQKPSTSNEASPPVAGPSASASTSSAPPPVDHPSSSSSTFHDLTPSSFPSHESRRRNAEQRAANLRADKLITHVEPNRVFCSLCQKWVQLRQDSSYCAYPWVQHRTKCLARHQRRSGGKASTVDNGGNREKGGGDADVDMDMDSGEGRAGQGEEDELDDSDEGSDAEGTATPPSHRTLPLPLPRPPPTTTRPSFPFAHHHHHPPPPPTVRRIHPPPHSALPHHPTLADLDTPGGRKHFIHASISYLFSTTYEPSDDLPISSLLAYLNAAMPVDKFEDFDTGEVARAVSALAVGGAGGGGGKWVFEGDVIRWIG